MGEKVRKLENGDERMKHCGSGQVLFYLTDSERFRV